MEEITSKIKMIFVIDIDLLEHCLMNILNISNKFYEPDLKDRIPHEGNSTLLLKCSSVRINNQFMLLI